ncbi:MAG: DapH/DapD/GlmU-related protein [Victivallaceae bacterium]|nr:acyltransferase [Victivallaceae bacterium]
MDVNSKLFEEMTRYLAADTVEADRRRAEILGYGGGVMFAPGAVVRIGENTIGENTYIGLFSYVNGDVRIGKEVLIGPHCSLPAGNHRFDPATKSFNTLRDGSRPITVGDGAWLAAGVTVTGGVSVGRGALVCANAVVTRDVPDYAIAAGVPAKIVGRIDPETGEQIWFKK